jgi:hypothetical protein
VRRRRLAYVERIRLARFVPASVLRTEPLTLHELARLSARASLSYELALQRARLVD